MIEKYGQALAEVSKWASFKFPTVEADEIHQALVLSLLEAGHTEQTITEKGGGRYLATAAFRTAAKIHREDTRAQTADLSETAEDAEELGAVLTATTDGSLTRPQEALEHQETMQAVLEHMQGIVAEAEVQYQDILRLYYLWGQELVTVAKTLGLPPNKKAANWHLSKARKTLTGAQVNDLNLWRQYLGSVVHSQPGEGSEALKASLQL